VAGDSPRIECYDLRERTKPVLTFECTPPPTSSHQELIHNAKWNCDGSLLAVSGTMDDVLIWDFNMPRTCAHKMGGVPGFKEAIAWCPWRSNVIACGNMSESWAMSDGELSNGLSRNPDGVLVCWNLSDSTQTSRVKTGKQIYTVAWAEATKELITSHVPLNNLNDDAHTAHSVVDIWKYPTLRNMGQLEFRGGALTAAEISPSNKVLVSINSKIRVHNFLDQPRHKPLVLPEEETLLSKGKQRGCVYSPVGHPVPIPPMGLVR
jgi:WD40 repeat protein